LLAEEDWILQLDCDPTLKNGQKEEQWKAHSNATHSDSYSYSYSYRAHTDLEQLPDRADSLLAHICREVETHPTEIFEVHILVHASGV
jgi:hypothetical protein